MFSVVFVCSSGNLYLTMHHGIGAEWEKVQESLSVESQPPFTSVACDLTKYSLQPSSDYVCLVRETHFHLRVWTEVPVQMLNILKQYRHYPFGRKKKRDHFVMCSTWFTISKLLMAKDQLIQIRSFAHFQLIRVFVSRKHKEAGTC